MKIGNNRKINKLVAVDNCLVDNNFLLVDILPAAAAVNNRLAVVVDNIVRIAVAAVVVVDSFAFDIVVVGNNHHDTVDRHAYHLHNRKSIGNRNRHPGSIHSRGEEG